jgi:hypothetical protein
MTPELHAEITRRWSTFLKQYGYAKEEDGNRKPAAGSEKPVPASRPAAVGG